MAGEEISTAEQGKGRDGLAGLLAVRPRWTGIAPASRHIECDGRWLMHAGPPLADARHPPAPILSSAVLACLYEGWAQTQSEAESLIRRGEVQLLPAQEHRCVTPLAALVSPSSSVLAVDDGAHLTPAVFAPLGTLGGPDLRFGTREAGVLKRMRVRDTVIADTLRAALVQPIELLPLARHAVAQGDDLHNRTAAATQALAGCLTARYVSAGSEWQQRADGLLQGLAATPLFFLTFWMAAAKLMLSAAERGHPNTLITRMGGNGEVFGVSVAANPNVWTTVPAAEPRGPYLDATKAGRRALGAIGDSAVIDALGFGGQALHLAPEPRAALKDYLPASAGMTVSPLLMAVHPQFERRDLRVGLDAQRIVASGIVPVVTLAMVDAAGEQGLLGRGVYLPPIELFSNTVNSVS